jgi:hypothetical protein
MPVKAKNLADFKAQFDPAVVIPNKIRAALEALAKEGREAWEYEQDFLKRCRVSPPHLSPFREQFLQHIVEVRDPGKNPRKVWFADPKVAKIARGE